MNFKPGQLVRRTKLSTLSYVIPIVPLGMVVQVLYIEGYSMTVTLLKDANKGYSAGRTVKVDIEHYSSVKP
jgi:hypothetical protein